MAKPSIQDVGLFFSFAVPTSIAIDIKLATIKIRNVKSSSASHNNSKNPFGSISGFLLLPKARSR